MRAEPAESTCLIDYPGEVIVPSDSALSKHATLLAMQGGGGHLFLLLHEYPLRQSKGVRL